MSSLLRTAGRAARHAPWAAPLAPLWPLLRRPYRAALGVAGRRRGIAVPVGGASLRLHPDFAAVGWETVERSSYRAFADEIRPGDVVFDVGAHIGTYTILAAEAVEASGRVVAYEPHDAALRHLRTHLAWNLADGGSERVVVRPAACGASDGTRAFYGPAGRAEGASGFLPVADREPRNVPVVALDREVARLGLVPSLIKIDVEGAEWDVLRGARRLLRRHRPRLLLSLHPDALARAGASPDAVLAWLARRGYVHQELERDHEIHVLSSAAGGASAGGGGR